MRLRLAVLILLALSGCDATRAQAKDDLPKRARELFGWFDKLSFEDTSDRKYVRIWIEGQTSDGFLLNDEGPAFRAVLADLTVSTIPKAGNGESDPNYSGYREIPLDAAAREILRDLRDPHYVRHWEDDHSGNYFDRLSRPSQIFVVARACAQHGSGSLAGQLVEALARHSIEDGANRWHPFPEWLHEDFGEALEWRARISFRDPTMTWSDLAAAYRRIGVLCPGTYADSSTKAMTEALNVQVAEEAAHGASPMSLDGLPVAEKAREIVWRLRDEQDPARDADDFWPRPWAQPVRMSNGAMEELRKLNLDAVPALLADLRTPERLSRSASRSTRYGGGVWINVTQELATDVLNDIAGVKFYWLTHWDKPEERWPKVSAAVEEWWHAVQTRGEKAWQVEAVRGGGRRASTCAECLETRYPDAFLEAALAGFAASLNSDDVYPRDELLKMLARHRGAGVEEALIADLKSATRMGDRIVLARLLREWGRAEAEEAIRGDWARIAARGFDARDIRTDRNPFSVGDGDIEALKFLGGSDNDESLRAVLAVWPKLPSDLRRDLVQSASQENLDGGETPRTVSPGRRTFTRHILLMALDDTTEFSGVMMGFEHGTVVDPRLCDLAAGILNAEKPGEFEFDRFAPESVRDRQRITILNAERRKDGVPELPLPPVPPKVQATKENSVSAVEWDSRSAAPGEDLTRQFAAWKGRPFKIEAAIAALSAYARKPQPGTNSLRVNVYRDGDSTGVVVRLRLGVGEPGKDDSLSVREMVCAGKECLHDASGAGSSGRSLDWDRFRRRAAEAIARPPQSPYMIRAEVALSN